MSGHGNNRRFGQWAVFQLGTNLGFARRGIFHEVRFSQCNDAASGAEVGEDLQVLLGLRHPAVIGSHNEQREVDCAYAGDHVFDEILMARYIDNA